MNNITYRGSADWMEKSFILTPIAGALNFGEGVIGCFGSIYAEDRQVKFKASIYQMGRGICGMVPVIGWLFLKCLGLLGDSKRAEIQNFSSANLSLFKDMSSKSFSYGTDLNYPFDLPNFQGIPDYNA